MKDLAKLLIAFLTLWLGAFSVISGALAALKVFGVI